MTAERELARELGPEGVLPGDTREYLTDATEARQLVGHADAIALPGDPHQVATVMGWCYEHDVPLVPRGGGTGLAGGAVPAGGVVLSLERLRTVRALEPHLWRAHVDAGVTTATLHRRAREAGLLYAPDPGASEQSQLGGNIATNAGGPHTFKYGVTGSWVTGLELVLAPGELVTVGGAVRKDVAGYDVKSLMIGSEGTLGVVTAARLKLIPAPEAQLPVVATYADTRAECEALLSVLANGIVAAAIEYLDGGALEAAPLPSVPSSGAFMLIAEADGSTAEAKRLRAELIEVLSEGAQSIHSPQDRGAIRELWRWRAGVSHAVAAQRGGKVSEDIVVPVERLREAVEATREIGARHRLPTCSWGHAGDGNLHSTFMVDRTDTGELRRAEQAAGELFALALGLKGSVSGEHGLGVTKRGAVPASAVEQSIKRLFDPKGLLNPGKKI